MIVRMSAMSVPHLIVDLLALWRVLKAKDDMQAHDWATKESPGGHGPYTAIQQKLHQSMLPNYDIFCTA